MRCRHEQPKAKAKVQATKEVDQGWCSWCSGLETGRSGGVEAWRGVEREGGRCRGQRLAWLEVGISGRGSRPYRDR